MTTIHADQIPVIDDENQTVWMLDDPTEPLSYEITWNKAAETWKILILTWNDKTEYWDDEASELTVSDVLMKCNVRSLVS